MVNGSTTPLGTRDDLAVGAAASVSKTGRCPGGKPGLPPLGAARPLLPGADIGPGGQSVASCAFWLSQPAAEGL